MEKIDTKIPGLKLLVTRQFMDIRGKFVKTFNSELFASFGLETQFQESFYTTSKRNVLRGFHVQTPPHESPKLVSVVEGAVLDVLLDLRRGSKTYGETFSAELSAANMHAMYIPAGVAHAFYVLGESATVSYQVGKCFNLSADSGIKWDSVGYSWPCTSPIISDKDNNLPPFESYKSRFWVIA